MYLLNKTIENIAAFEVQENFQYLRENTLYLNENVVEQNTDCLGVFIENRFFVFSNYVDFKSKILSLSDNYIIDIVSHNIQDLKTSQGFLAYKYDYNFNSILILLDHDLKYKNDIGLTNVIISLIKNDVGIQKINGHLKAYSLPSAQPLWQFALEELGTFMDSSNKGTPLEVLRFIGVWQEVLWVGLNSGALLLLDINSGKMLDLLDIAFALGIPKKEFGMDIRDFSLDQNTGLIYGLSYRYFVQIDLFTKKPVLIKDYKEEGLEIKSSTVTQHLIAFTAVHDSNRRITPDHLGVADKKTGEVLWYEKIVTNAFLMGNPQYAQNKLYQLDSKNNLYIFEKETSSPLETS